MIVEKLTFPNLSDIDKWFTCQEMQETVDILINGNYDGEAKLRLHYYGTGTRAVVIRGVDSLALPATRIGSLVDHAYYLSGVAYFDDIFWADKFGKTCVFNNDAPIYQLFMKDTIAKIHTVNTNYNLLSKVAMANVFNTMNVSIEFLSDADVILLPSRDKFACGFSRMIYPDPTKRTQTDQLIRYEGGWISYRIDHDLFQEILPEVEYNRDLSSDPDHGGIDGIENQFPLFNREQFYTAWFNEIAALIEDDPRVTIVEKTIK